MGRKGWLNVTIMITINFLTPARDLKSSDADERGGPDLPVLSYSPARLEVRDITPATSIMGQCVVSLPEWKSNLIFSQKIVTELAVAYLIIIVLL